MSRQRGVATSDSPSGHARWNSDAVLQSSCDSGNFRVVLLCIDDEAGH
jgi:hypothetical protein